MRGALTVGLAGLTAGTAGAARAETTAPSATDTTGQASAGASATTEDQPGITLDAVTPGTLRPGENLKVTATITAGSDAVTAGSRVDLSLRTHKLSTRYNVAAWATARPGEGLGDQLTSEPITVDIPAHQSRRVTLSVAASRTGLVDEPSQFGPRALAVALMDPSSNRLAVNHTYLVWYPADTEVHKVAMSVVVPVTAGQPSPTTGLPTTSRLTQETAADGRLTSLLHAAGRPGVTLAVDPSLLVANGSEGSGSRVVPWRSQLTKASRTNQTLVLPSADPDVAALAHAGADSLLSTAVSRARTQAADLSKPLTGVAMPADGQMDEKTAALLTRNGYTCAILRASAQPTLAEQVVTQSGRSRISFPGSNTSMCGLLADDTITDVLAGPSTEAPDAPTGTAAVQRLLAESAAVAAENPSAPRQLLAMAPRQWNPGSTGRAQLNALLGQPWVTAARLSSLMKKHVPAVQRSAPTITGRSREAELAESGITAVTEQLGVVAMTAGAAVSGRDSITGSMQQPAIGMMSQAWRGDWTAWNAAQQAFTDAVGSLRRAVHVVPGSSINQVSQDVRLPVTVQNDLDVPVEVRLRAAPTTNLLRVVDGDVTVRVQQHSHTAARVSVRGVGSGEAQVRMTVLTPDGFTLDDADAIRVRVRADWENRATFVAGGVFLCILVAGIVRTLRRGRTRADTIDPTTGESAP